MTSILYYFDTVVLPTHSNTKFVHLWSFGEEINPDTTERQYLYSWKNGVVITPALETFSIDTNEELPNLDTRANHISGDEKNQQIADRIIAAINHLQASLPILHH